MFAAALGRHRRHGALNQFQQGLLNTLARHIPRNGRIVRLAGNLVDLIDVDNTALRTLDFVIAALQQLLNDVFDIFPHITGFGQRGRIGHHKGHIQSARQCLCQQCFTRTGRPNQQDIAFGQLDVILAGFFLVTQTFVVVVDRHCQRPLGWLLPDNITIQRALDVGWGWEIGPVFRSDVAHRQFVADDFIAEVNALITNEHRRTCNEFFNFVLTFSAKRTVQGLFARGAFFFGH